MFDQFKKELNALKNQMNQGKQVQEEAKMPVPEPQDLQQFIDELKEKMKFDELKKDQEALQIKVRQMESLLIKQPIAQPESKAENHLEVFRQQWPVQLKDDSYLQKALNANIHQRVADLIVNERL